MIGRMYLIGACVLMLLTINVVIVLALTWPISEFSIAKAGAFGDSFGWLNAAFSGFAFLGVVWTLVHQREELRESREATRVERFEGLFFRLMELVRKNLEEIKIAAPDGGQPLYGVDALAHYCHRVRANMNGQDKWLASPNGRLVYEAILHKSVRHMPAQARYLGTLENLLELIERDLKTVELRIPYWETLAQQLTSGEARYLLFWALRGKTNDVLSELISRAPPLRKRIAAISPSWPQRALYKRIYGFDLDAQKESFPAIFGARQYRSIRKQAQGELKASQS